MTAGDRILSARTPQRALAAIRVALSAAGANLGERMAAALVGDAAAVRAYVAASDELVSALLEAIHDARPDLVVRAESGLLLVDAERRPAPYSPEVLELGMLEAPFSPWVARFGPGEGVVLFWLSRLREALPGHQPLRLPHGGAALPHWEAVDRQAVTRFLERVREELRARHQAAPPLARLRRQLALSVSDLGRLFGVSRQAAAAWLARGVPAARAAKLQALLAIAELLRHRLREDRIAGVVRKPAAVYGGLSILEMIAADRQEEVLARVRDSFDWASAA